MGTSKGIPILISLDAQSAINGQPEETIRLITTGEMQEKHGITIIHYQETLDETEPPQDIVLQISDREVTMTREGKFGGDMVFKKGSRFQSKYRTPHGDLDMALFCTKADYQKAEEGGELRLQYELDLGGQITTVHHMTFHWMRKKDA